MPSREDLKRAVECQVQAALRMEAYWVYRDRWEKEDGDTEMRTAIRMHRYAGEFYREARERMGVS